MKEDQGKIKLVSEEKKLRKTWLPNSKRNTGIRGTWPIERIQIKTLRRRLFSRERTWQKQGREA